jgi:transcriptional regulator with XRE-family HTH domain
VSVEVSEKVISRAIGEEMRRARAANGWSREQLVSRLPSGIGARTLLSYEHGTRHLTLLRFIEVCRALGVSASHVLGLGLQRARIYLENLALWVDLRALLADRTDGFQAMIVWAHNKLIEYPGGIVEVTPTSVRELATMIGSTHRELAAYLTRFTPDLDQIPEGDNHAGSAAI